MKTKNSVAVILIAIIAALSASSQTRQYYDCTILNIFHGNPEMVADDLSGINKFAQNGQLEVYNGSAIYNLARDASKRLIHFETDEVEYHVSYINEQSDKVRKIQETHKSSKDGQNICSWQFQHGNDDSFPYMSFHGEFTINGKKHYPWFFSESLTEIVTDDNQNMIQATRNRKIHDDSAEGIVPELKDKILRRLISYYDEPSLLNASDESQRESQFRSLISSPIGFTYDYKGNWMIENQLEDYLKKSGINYQTTTSNNTRILNFTPPRDVKYSGFEGRLMKMSIYSIDLIGAEYQFVASTKNIATLYDDFVQMCEKSGIYGKQETNQNHVTSFYAYGNDGLLTISTQKNKSYKLQSISIIKGYAAGNDQETLILRMSLEVNR